MNTNETVSNKTAALYRVIYAKWAELDIDAFEAWLSSVGITWAELDNEVADAPPGAVAVWEGPGFEDETRKQCWIVPDSTAARLLGDADNA